MDDLEVDNLIHATVIFVVYLFIMVTLYYLLSGPIDALFDGFASGDYGEHTDKMSLYLPDIRWAVQTAFAIGAAIPMTWFIFWIFSSEPFIGMRRRF